MPSTRTDGDGLLLLLQLSDSALPTGAFSHSFGLETYLDRGVVTDEATFARWLAAYLMQTTYADLLAVRLAAESAGPDDVRRIDALMHAATVPRQVRDAGVSMGARMARIAAIALPDAELLRGYRSDVEEGRCHGHPAIVFGLAVRAAGVGVDDAVAAYAMSLATSLTQNAIRGIPIGQDAGQRVLSGVRGTIRETVAAVRAREVEDLGAAAPGLEIAQMVHEQQRARMFMS